MAMIHVKYPKSYSTMCGRRNGYGNLQALTSEDFITSYQKNNGKGFCSKCAKSLIESGKLVAADNTITADMQVVIDKITAGTQSLKEEFIQKTIAFAKRMFAKHKEKNAWSAKEWMDAFGIESELKPVGYHGSQVERWAPVSGEYHRKPYYAMQRAQAKTRDIVNKGYAAFEQDEVDAANRHYVYSVMKLADRIMEKSMNISKMKVITGRVDVNIETTISDGENTVRAFTIIAEGPIVRPHYRYLVH